MQLENKFTIEAPLDKAWEALNTPEMIAPCFPGATLTEYEGDSFSGTVKVKLGPISLTYKGKGTYIERDEAAHRVVIEASGRDSRGNGTAKATVTGTLTADGPDRTAATMVTDMTITGRPAQFGRAVISDVADKIIGQFAECVARKLTATEEPAPLATAEPSPVATTETAPAPTSATAAASTSNGAAVSTASPAANSAAESVSVAAAPAAGSTAPTSAAPASTGQPVATKPATAARPTGPVHSEVDAIDLLDAAGSPVLKRLVPIVGAGVLLVLVILLIRRLRS